MTDLLREQMGFDGLCISDYGGIENSHNYQRIGESMADAGEMALAAGMDVEMPSPAGYGKELQERFANQALDIGVLDQAVYRVLCAKFRMGLFEHPYPLMDDKLENVYRKADKGKQLTRQSAMESMTLLKNDGILPLRKDAPVYFQKEQKAWRLYAHIYDGIYLCGGEQYCRGCRD